MSAEEPLIITMKDVRAANMCGGGTRKFLADHGFDLSTFLKEGLPAEVLEATGDALALKVVEVARERRK